MQALSSCCTQSIASIQLGSSGLSFPAFHILGREGEEGNSPRKEDIKKELNGLGQARQGKS